MVKITINNLWAHYHWSFLFCLFDLLRFFESIPFWYGLIQSLKPLRIDVLFGLFFGKICEHWVIICRFQLYRLFLSFVWLSFFKGHRIYHILGWLRVDLLKSWRLLNHRRLRYFCCRFLARLELTFGFDWGSIAYPEILWLPGLLFSLGFNRFCVIAVDIPWIFFNLLRFFFHNCLRLDSYCWKLMIFVFNVG